MSPFLTEAQEFIPILAGVFMRVSAIAFLTPGLGERAIPMRVRLVAAVAFTAILVPIIANDPVDLPETTTAFVELLVAEALIGLLLGFALRLFIFTLQTAGSIIAQHVSLSQLFGPTVGFESEAPYTAILVMGGVALAVTADLHFHIAAALVQSYSTFSFGTFPNADWVGGWSADQTGKALHTAFALSSPFIILGFIYSLALAAASRAMPQLMAAFVGAPAITLAGLALFAAATPILLLAWLQGFDRGFAEFFGLAP